MLNALQNVLLKTKAYIYLAATVHRKKISFSFTCDVWAVIVDAGVCEIITKPFISVGRRRRAPQRSHFSNWLIDVNVVNWHLQKFDFQKQCDIDNHCFRLLILVTSSTTYDTTIFYLFWLEMWITALNFRFLRIAYTLGIALNH